MNLLERMYSFATNRKLLNITFWSMVAAVALVAIYTHRVAAFTLPVPSGDEAMFVWQAHAVEVSNSFVAPEIDPKNPILLLPLTYSASLGWVFKIFGCSIAVARNFSLVLVLAGFVVLASLTKRMSAPRMALLMLGGIMLNSHFVVMANAVRMEPLLLIVLSLSFLLMQRGQIWASLAALSISPMIHPNGVLYLGAAVVYAVGAHRVYRKSPGRLAVILFGIAAFIWFANGIYVLRYWNSFVHDCAHRFGEMAATSGKAGMARLGVGPLVRLGLIGVVAAIGAWRRINVGYLLVFAVGAWLHSHLRYEEPYEPFRDLSYLLVALALLEIGVAEVGSARSPTIRLLQPLVAGALGILFLGWLFRGGKIENPKGYLNNLNLAGMHVDRTGCYFRDEDRRTLLALINSIEPGRPITVEVYPWSDGLLIADLKDTRVLYRVPYFDPVFRPAKEWVWGYGPTEAPVPDLYIVRASHYIPAYLQFRTDAMIARAMKHPEVGQPIIVHTRDTTEIWYAMRPVKQLN